MSKNIKCPECGGHECGVTDVKQPARQPPSQRTCAWVVGLFNEERDKVLAIAYALESILKPSGDYEGNVTAWRLSQIICEYLDDTSLLKEARKSLGCEVTP
jgi:hypothetical protein